MVSDSALADILRLLARQPGSFQPLREFQGIECNGGHRASVAARGCLAEISARLEGKVAEACSETLKRVFGAVGLQTLAILGGVADLLRLFGT